MSNAKIPTGTDQRRSDLSIDQQIALKTRAAQLQKDFAQTFGVETIERFLHSSYEQFARRATIATFLPLLAERFARQRLHALAKVEGKGGEGKPADVVIIMGCGDACSIFPGRRYQDWNLVDPAGLGIGAVRPIRDDIEQRVSALLAELDLPANH